jgi:hypothetical protein
LITQDDLLLLSPIDNLFQNISDTETFLERMLATPFVQGIKEAIITLSTSLENDSYILEEWSRFQPKWFFSAYFRQRKFKIYSVSTFESI